MQRISDSLPRCTTLPAEPIPTPLSIVPNSNLGFSEGSEGGRWGRKAEVDSAPLPLPRLCVQDPGGCAVIQGKRVWEDHGIQRGQVGPEPRKPSTHSPSFCVILQGTSKVCASKSTTFRKTRTTKLTPQSISSVSHTRCFNLPPAEGSLSLFFLRIKGQVCSAPCSQQRAGSCCSLLTGQLLLMPQDSPETSPPPGSHPSLSGVPSSS